MSALDFLLGLPADSVAGGILLRSVLSAVAAMTVLGLFTPSGGRG